MREILCQGPEAVLSKGFALATGLTGKAITSSKMAIKNNIFKLCFHDGALIVKDNSSYQD